MDTPTDPTDDALRIPVLRRVAVSTSGASSNLCVAPWFSAPKVLMMLTLLNSLKRHHYLIAQLARREISERYRGTLLGFVWPFLTPLSMLCIYTAVFGGIFKASWPGQEDTGLAGYAVMLFSGLIVYQVFSECANRGPLLILSVPNYVKKVVFPLEILPVSAVIGALFQGAINILVLLLVHAAVNHTIVWTIVLLPIVWLPLAAWCLGMLWWLSALGVYLRDIQHGVAIGLQVLFFASPILYPLERVPAAARPWLQLNPLTAMIDAHRSILIEGALPAWTPWFLSLAAGVLVMWSGFAFFRHVRKGFADVL